MFGPSDNGYFSGHLTSRTKIDGYDQSWRDGSNALKGLAQPSYSEVEFVHGSERGSHLVNRRRKKKRECDGTGNISTLSGVVPGQRQIALVSVYINESTSGHSISVHGQALSSHTVVEYLYKSTCVVGVAGNCLGIARCRQAGELGSHVPG